MEIETSRSIWAPGYWISKNKNFQHMTELIQDQLYHNFLFHQVHNDGAVFCPLWWQQLTLYGNYLWQWMAITAFSVDYQVASVRALCVCPCTKSPSQKCTKSHSLHSTPSYQQSHSPSIISAPCLCYSSTVDVVQSQVHTSQHLHHISPLSVSL